MRKNEKTLAGLFLKYMVFFCVNTLMILILVYGSFNMLFATKILIPANYAEQELNKNAAKLISVKHVTEEMIPAGCTYGVYSGGGKWLYGNLPEKQRKTVWKQYLDKNTYGSNKKYYRFITRKNGEICIVEYEIRARFAGTPEKRMAFNADLLIILPFTVLFLTQAFLLSKGFAARLRVRLQALNDVTEKISGNNLDFEVTSSDIKEINEIMSSLNQMKSALQDSLKHQWEMERQREEQLSALAHDIKTPLTIIRGNAELLEESILEKGGKECNDNILEQVAEIEKYLEAMREVMLQKEYRTSTETVSCGRMADLLAAQAVQYADAKQIKIAVEEYSLRGELEADVAQIMRAWNNLVSNALDYTRQESGIYICFENKGAYMTASVIDYGPGFSKQDIRCGKEEFYRGDSSRNDRSHQGLGLYIAHQLAGNQGGMLTIGNTEKTGGAKVVLWLKRK